LLVIITEEVLKGVTNPATEVKVWGLTDRDQVALGRLLQNKGLSRAADRQLRLNHKEDLGDRQQVKAAFQSIHFIEADSDFHSLDSSTFAVT
jgi:hypothetical protein